MKIPKWHLDELARREKLVKEGKAKFHDFAEVKKRLQRYNRKRKISQR